MAKIVIKTIITILQVMLITFMATACENKNDKALTWVSASYMTLLTIAIWI